MRVLLTLLFGVSLLALGASPAQALSCVGPDVVLSEASVVFTGRVVDSDRSRLLVEVDEVWRGRDVAGRQWLHVDMPGWTSWAVSSKRLREHISEPSPWVFAPTRGAINPCSAWPAATPEVRSARPDAPAAPVAVTPPVEPAGRGDETTTRTVVAGVGTLALAVALALAWRYRRLSD